MVKDGQSQSQTIETWLMEKFWGSVVKKLEEGSGDRSGIHVTDLVYDCLRRAYYDKTYSEVVGAVSDSEGLAVLWIGQMLHEMPLDPENCEHEKPIGVSFGEFKVEGRIDELCKHPNGTYVVVDKKTTRSIPNNPHDHHFKQVLFYSSILNKNYGLNVSHVAILYIDVSNLKAKSFVMPVNQMAIDTAYKELERKAKVLGFALKTKNAPPASPGWLCGYCPYFKKCVKDGWNGMTIIEKGEGKEAQEAQ